MGYYGFYSDTGDQATPSGKRSFVRALAQAISSKRIGVGRRVCIAKRSRSGTADKTVECCERGKCRAVRR